MAAKKIISDTIVVDERSGTLMELSDMAIVRSGESTRMPETDMPEAEFINEREEVEVEIKCICGVPEDWS